MLPRFRVDLDEAISVSGDDLKTTVASIFEKVGVPPEDAELGADVLVLADLRGVDSHGVSNMLRSYLGGYQRGEINPRPNIIRRPRNRRHRQHRLRPRPGHHRNP